MKYKIIKHPLHIAIDGPVASGKGTISALLSLRLGIIYIYTGGMYRALALSCLRNQVTTANETDVLAQLQKISITLSPKVNGDSSCLVFLNGEDVTHEIKKPNIAQTAPLVAKIPEVRKHMVLLQQQLAKNTSVIMEGRDISLRVLPDAQLKVYLDASIVERAQRLFLLWQKQGISTSIEDARLAAKERDAHDQSRSVDPLQKTPDAQVVQTDGMKPDEVVDAIINKLIAQKLIEPV